MMGKAYKIAVIFLIMGGHTLLFSQVKYSTVFELKAPFETTSIHVVGDFNKWSQTENPLIYSYDKDVWETTIELEPGIYEYRYLLNGMNYIKDPDNPLWGGQNSNSLMFVTEPKQPILKNFKPETGTSIQESVFQVAADYWDGTELNDLNIAVSKIYIDDSPQEIQYIPEKRLLRCYTPRLNDGEHLLRVAAEDNKGNRAIPLNSFIVVNAENRAPIVEAGYTIISGINENITVNTGNFYDPDFDPIQKYQWRLLSKPQNSKAKLDNSKSAYPMIKPDFEGRYVLSVKTSDGYLESQEDSVDIYAFVRRKYPTEFTFADSAYTKIYESLVDCVAVVGEFNQWSASATQMNDYNKDGVWSAWVDLDPGDYE